MTLTRKSITWAIAGLALTGALVGGAGIAVAATGMPSPAPSPSNTWSVDPPHGHLGDSAGIRDRDERQAMAFDEDSPMAAAADYLDVSLTDLRADLHNGQSLADVAAGQGKPVSGLEQAIKSHLDATLNATHSSGSGAGLMGFRMGSMMGR